MDHRFPTADRWANEKAEISLWCKARPAGLSVAHQLKAGADQLRLCLRPAHATSPRFAGAGWRADLPSFKTMLEAPRRGCNHNAKPFAHCLQSGLAEIIPQADCRGLQSSGSWRGFIPAICSGVLSRWPRSNSRCPQKTRLRSKSANPMWNSWASFWSPWP